MTSAVAPGRRTGESERTLPSQRTGEVAGPEGRPTGLPRVARELVVGVVVVAALWLTGRSGSPLLELPGQPGALAVGLGIGLTIRRGVGTWPLVAVGSALVAAGQPAAVLVATVAACVLEAVVAAVVVERFGGGRKAPLSRVRDVVVLVGPVGLGATLLGAGVTIAGLLASDVVGRDTWWDTLTVVWAVHAIGALVIAPVVLLVRRPRRVDVEPRAVLEPVVCLLVVLGLSLWVFSGGFDFPYVIFPALVWVGVRLGTPGTVAATVLVGVVAYAGTLDGRGPFAEADHPAVGLGLFLVVIAATKLVLSAVVAERARADEETRRLTAELARNVESLTQANRDLEAFSYSVSHDLRAPLRNIDGFASKLSRRHSDELGEQGIHYLQRIRANTTSMGNLIDEMLLLSRLQKQRLRTRPVAVDSVVRDALSQLESVIADREVDLRVDPLPTVVADGALLTQVFVNLVGNALKYSRERSPARVVVRADRDEGGRTVFSVSDNGVGFDMQYADKLFGIFQRLHRAEDYEGSGVGLAIVARIVARHGGRVWADSTVGSGSTFYFTLEGTDVADR